MQTLTPEEITQAKDLKASGLKADEIFNRIAANRTGNATPSSYTPSITPGITQQSDFNQDVIETGKAIGGSFKKFATNLGRAATQENLSVPQRLVGGALTVPTLGLDIAGDALTGVAKASVGQEVEEKATAAIESGVEKAVETDFAQGIMNWYDNQSPEEQYTTSQIIMPLTEALAEAGTGGIFGKILSRGKRAIPDRGKVEQVVNEAVNEASTGNPAPANRIAQQTVPEAEREALVSSLAESYESSILSNRSSVTGRLDDIAENSSFGTNRVTRQDVLKEFANEGYIPVVNDQLADFSDALYDLERRQTKLMQDLEPVIQRSQGTIAKSDLRGRVMESIENNPTFMLRKSRAESELDRIFNELPDQLSVVDINEIRKRANAESRSFNKAGNFQEGDVMYTLGNVTRQSLDEFIPDELARRANAEYGRLEKLKQVADTLDRQRLDVGIFGRTIGSYIGTVLASTAGLSVGGPGGLVLAGVASNLGQNWLADMVRRRMFRPEVQEKIRTVLQQDDKLREELLAKANQQDRDTLTRFVLEAPKEGSPRSEVGSGAPVAMGGQTPTGRVEPGITERVREGAVRAPEGERTPTELEGVLREDIDAVEQAVYEMEAEMSGQTRPSVGENFVQTADGSAYRFKELPSWIPKEYRDADLMERVMNNIVNNKKPRSNASNEIELQRVVEERIKTRVAEIKKGKGDMGVFSGDTAFAAALMVGGTYFLANEDSELLPIVAIGSMMANPTARRSALQNAKMMAAKGKKLPATYKRKIESELQQYDTGMMTVQKDGVPTTIAPDEVDMRIEELQKKNYEGKLTNKEALEAEELMANKGILVEPEGKAKAATPETTDLVEEAKGKTLDANEITDIPDIPVKKTEGGNAILYWGGDKPLSELDINKMAPDTQNVRGGGVMLTNNPDYAELYARFSDTELRGRSPKVGRDKGYVQTFELTKPLFDTSTELSTKDVAAIKKAYTELLEIDADEAGFPNTNNAEKIWDWLTEDTGLDLAVIQDAGFGGIKEIGSNEVQIFDTKYLKNTDSKAIDFN